MADEWTLTLPSNGKPPQAVVVLIGWLGALPRHLEKYSSTVYTDWNCATLSGTAHTRTIMFKKDEVLAKLAKEGLTALSDFLESSNCPRLPVFFHIFSNGGAFVWEHMDKLLGSANDRLFSSLTSIDTEDTPLHCNTNFYAIRRNLSGVIFDSSPAYPTWRSGKAALEGSLGGSAPVLLKFFLSCVLYVAYQIELAVNFLRGNRQHRLLEFWDYFLESELCDQEAFIYSTSDGVTDASHLQDFIAGRRRRRGATVSVLEFEDSDHVQHFVRHQERYSAFARQFVLDCLEIHNAS
jgi:hypothetical protein